MPVSCQFCKQTTNSSFAKWVHYSSFRGAGNLNTIKFRKVWPLHILTYPNISSVIRLMKFLACKLAMFFLTDILPAIDTQFYLLVQYSCICGPCTPYSCTYCIKQQRIAMHPCPYYETPVQVRQAWHGTVWLNRLSWSLIYMQVSRLMRLYNTRSGTVVARWSIRKSMANLQPRNFISHYTPLRLE